MKNAMRTNATMMAVVRKYWVERDMGPHLSDAPNGSG
jgi:hypothetical protein